MSARPQRKSAVDAIAKIREVLEWESCTESSEAFKAAAARMEVEFTSAKRRRTALAHSMLTTPTKADSEDDAESESDAESDADSSSAEGSSEQSSSDMYSDPGSGEEDAPLGSGEEDDADDGAAPLGSPV